VKPISPSNTEAANLTTRESTLRQAHAKLESQYSELQRHYTDLQTQNHEFVTQLTGHLDGKKQEVKSLREEVQQQKEMIVSLKHLLITKEQQATTMQATLLQEQTKMQRMQGIVSGKEGHPSGANSPATSRSPSTTDGSDAHAQHLAQLVATHAAEVKDLKRQVKSQLKEVKALAAEQSAWHEERAVLQGKVQNLEDQLVMLKRAQAQAGDADTVHALREENTQLSTENSVLIETVTELEEKILTITTRSGSAASTSSSAVAAAHAKEWDRLRMDIVELEKDNASLREHIDEIAAESGGGDASRAAARFERERAEFQRTEALLQTQVTHLTAELGTIKSQLASLQKSYAELEEDNRSMINILETEDEEKASGYASSQALQDAKRSLVKSQKELAEQELIMQKMDQENEHLNATNAKLNLKYDAMAKENSELKKQVSSSNMNGASDGLARDGRAIAHSHTVSALPASVAAHPARTASTSSLSGHSPSPSQLLENHSHLEAKLGHLLSAYEQLIAQERIRVPKFDDDAPTPSTTPSMVSPQSAGGSHTPTLLAALPSGVARHGRSMSAAPIQHPSHVDHAWRRVRRLNSLLVQHHVCLSDASSLQELQRHAAELEQAGLTLEEEYKEMRAETQVHVRQDAIP
jgi:myosin heavy subunit